VGGSDSHLPASPRHFNAPITTVSERSTSSSPLSHASSDELPQQDDCFFCEKAGKQQQLVRHISAESQPQLWPRQGKSASPRGTNEGIGKPILAATNANNKMEAVNFVRTTPEF